MFQKLSKILITAVCIGAVGLSGNVFAYDSEAVYNEAVASIKNYDMSDALRSAISAVNTQIPDFIPYYEMSFAPSEIDGRTCGIDARYPVGGIGCGWGDKLSLIFVLGTAEGYITKSEDEFDLEQDIPSQLADKSFAEIIALAKASSAYINNTEVAGVEFKQFVDQREAVYNRGVESLRTNLPKVDPSLTNPDTKTAAELVTIYNNLPIVSNGTYDDLISAYNTAYMFSSYIGNGVIEDPNSDEQVLEAFGKLVAAAKAINPNFTVNLPKKSTPTAPDTGKTKEEEISAVVATAIASITGIAVVAGSVVVAKSYLFSPLKRRK